MHFTPLMISENFLTLPVFDVAMSATFRVQVPFGFCPLKADRGFAGAKVPVKGADVDTMDWMEPAAASSSRVWQKWFPVLDAPPGRFMSVTVVAAGDVSFRTRSPTARCVMPAVVDPAAGEQLVPSTRKSMVGMTPG